MSSKLERINAEIKKTLSIILANQLRDPRISGMVTIVQVGVSADLSNCKVFVSVLAKNEAEEQETFKTLQSSSSYIRKNLAKKLNLRITPALHFLLDQSWKESEKMDRLLSSIDIPKGE